MWSWREELREAAWLATLVAGLSIIAVTIALVSVGVVA
jgi:hypothetical protein